MGERAPKEENFGRTICLNMLPDLGTRRERHRAFEDGTPGVVGSVCIYIYGGYAISRQRISKARNN